MRARQAALAAFGAAALVGAALVATPAAAAPPTASVARACAKSTRVGVMACMALRRTDIGGRSLNAGPNATPSGYGPADLQSAYKLPASATTTTVAIVDAFDDPTAESDLATYRSQFGLPACTTANGCFRKVNQNGANGPFPPVDAGWAGEISLDVDMVSAVCPTCHILLVEANTNNDADLFASINTSVSLGAKYVSNSWGGPEDSSQTAFDTSSLNHPGVAITASTGDDGTGASFPATSRFVTAVGGTSLNRSTNARGWTESAWSGAGSGCSAFDAKPTWQTVTTNCTRRAEADVSAVADPNTGVAVFLTTGGSGWAVFGGTSASAPIIASVYALAGTPGASDFPASYPYAHTGNLFDVTTGNNGTCGAPICRAGTGWDGPTGLGTPNGTAAFAPGGAAGVAVNNPGNQTSTVGSSVSLTLTASGGTGTFTWSATGLPAGLSLNASTGVISGSPTTVGSSSVTVTATSGTSSGSASFTWTVNTTGGCSATQVLGNPGFEGASATPWTATAGVINANGSGQTSRSGTKFAWLDGYGTTHTDNLTQTVTVPAGCASASLTFWLKITSAETTTTTQFDKLTVKAGSTTLGTFSNLNKGTTYVQRTFSLNAFIGQSVTITFTGVEDSSLQTSFVIDDTALNVS